MRVSATILAAGDSARMGEENKLLLPINGVSIITHVIQTVLDSQLTPVHVVTGYDHLNVRNAIPNSVDKIINNENWESGMAGSIYTAISTLPGDVSGNMIVLGDMPNLQVQTLDVLVTEFIFHDGDRIIYPLYNNRQANPVIFPKKYFKEIFTSTGDRGCKKILKQYPGDAVGVPVESEEVILDCDTKDDYFQLINKPKDHV